MAINICRTIFHVKTNGGLSVDSYIDTLRSQFSATASIYIILFDVYPCAFRPHYINNKRVAKIRIAPL